MPLTPEQERIRQLFAGNPLANRPLPAQEPAVMGPQQQEEVPYSTPQEGYLNAGYRPENDSKYQDIVGNRFGQIAGIGQIATSQAQQSARAEAARKYAAQQAEQNRLAQNAASAAYSGGDEGYSYTGVRTDNEKRNAVIAAAAKQKGLPYSWGGGNAKGASYGLTGAGERHGSSKTFGFDCSGLVQYAFAQVGIKLPRLGNQQLARGVRTPIGKLQPGDLVGKPGHVAVYAGNGMMWEAPTFGKHVRLVPVRSGMFGVHINY